MGFAFSCEKNFLLGAVLDSDIDGIWPALSSGVDIDSRDCEGDTVLRYAVALDDRFVVTILIANNSHLTIRNSKGETPLFIADSKGHDEVVRLLLEAGADPSILNRWGIVPKSKEWMNDGTQSTWVM